jgi:hypothetical protein
LGTFIPGAAATFSADEIFFPKFGIEKKPREWLDEYTTSRPDEVHIQLLRDENLSTQQQLMVE